jgi:adenine-specific DNA-methyltransferase
MSPRKPTSKGPKPVVATVHSDKRSNIPTADAHDFIGPSVEAPVPWVTERDPSLDPQLVWKGKAAESPLLEEAAPPIYIQEKIDPRVLVENLRRTAARPEDEPELTLFGGFDGLGDLDRVEFYRHDANWSNRMILGDSLAVMASLAERESLRGKVQMIYIDPPYGIRFGSNWQVSARKRDVKDGKYEDTSREVEQIKAFRDTWELGIHSYLHYLRDRLLAARDLLTESGSCFVQIGDENVHLVRSLMDEVFGSENFAGMIFFLKTTGKGSRTIDSSGDYLLWYGKEISAVKVRELFVTRKTSTIDDAYSMVELEDGTTRNLSAAEKRGDAPMPRGRRFMPSSIYSDSGGSTTSGEFTFGGEAFTPLPGYYWRTNQRGLLNLAKAERLVKVGKYLRFIMYADDYPVVRLNNYWDDVRAGGFGEAKVYVVQTTTDVVERCMLLCTDPGDLVLDPTCGSGTTAYVGEQWGRRWITIDTSRVALALARQRLMGTRYPYYVLADSPEGRAEEETRTGNRLPQAETTGDIRHGFVYERVQHITLRSIANNPDIKEGMSRDEIDAAIKRHADFELLYDKPAVDKSKVRVTGPFTVESLSPHRALAFAGAPEPAAEREAAVDPSGASFEQTILDHLTRAGIQNGRRNERLELEVVEPYAGDHVQAIGLQRDTELRIGISIGPQYGTVGPSWIKQAAREALKIRDLHMLAVLGFAYDPQAIGASEDHVTSSEGFADVAAERQLGRLPVLLVRMNADLVMGEDLKATGAGNLFTVFGEPDVEIRTTDDDQVIVELLGVDVYDPTSGAVRSRDTGHIALWMIDTDYDEESFFVRHCYFTGGNDPYTKLKRDLKAEIDEDAWATMYRTESRPFARPSTGKIAVKVINDYGDEVLQVFEV